ncbi:MAG: acyl--CoA ligase [Sphaerochaetaceae bacterium]|nr:acyl--CoA ligase [Sphaerochaetaceae bacterium]
MSVYRAIVEANEQHQDDAALIFMGKRISYKQLICQANRVADIMTSLNIRKGEMILLGANSPQAVSILLACSKIGVGVMILTDRTTSELFIHAVSDIDIPLIFCTNDVYLRFSENNAADELSHIVILPYDKPIGEDCSDKEYSESSSNICTWDVFLNFKITECAEEVWGGYFPLTISASTGSTGAPKGIVMENRSYIALEKIVRRAGFDWNRGDVLSATLSTGVVSGTSLLLLVPLMMGLTVLQHPRYPGKYPFATFLKDSALYRANILFSPPSLWLAMIASFSGELDLSDVKCAYTIGEAVSEVEYNTITGFLKEKRAKDRLRNMYGMSETNSMVTFAPYNLKNPVCAGVAVPYNTVSIFDHDTLKEKQYGETGEIFIYTPTAMREYIYDPKETKNFFIRDEEGRKWVRTGDLGVMNHNGELTVLGRISQRFVAPDGKCVYPYIVENVLKKEPEVSCIKMVNMMYNGKNVYSVHIIPNQPITDKDALAEKLFAILSDCKDIPVLPKLIKIRDSFPKNQGGKVDMLKLSQEKDDFIDCSNYAVK